ncbi:cell wall-binding repeat-containing protein, partial [Clostridium sp. UBA7503]|uniref:cell wall-binding repeat-containing protein n=1 Tax=Clostridium sp. UBA7503 TaxID=1946377 RepID=UPI003217A751
DRFETSLKIANYFTRDTQTTALVSYGLNFPDALAGGALASKTASPILLVNKDVTAQKAFLDKSNITKLYVLGSTSAVSDSIVSQLKK